MCVCAMGCVFVCALRAFRQFFFCHLCREFALTIYDEQTNEIEKRGNTENGYTLALIGDGGGGDAVMHVKMS